MLLCPNCTETLKKDKNHGEGVWYCPDKDCGMTWFILDLKRPQYLETKTKKKKGVSVV